MVETCYDCQLWSALAAAGVGSLPGSRLGGNVQTKSSFRPIREGLCSHATVPAEPCSAVSPCLSASQDDAFLWEKKPGRTPLLWAERVTATEAGGPRVSTLLIITMATISSISPSPPSEARRRPPSLIIDLTSCASSPLRAGHSGTWAPGPGHWSLDITYTSSNTTLPHFTLPWPSTGLSSKFQDGGNSASQAWLPVKLKSPHFKHKSGGFTLA